MISSFRLDGPRIVIFKTEGDGQTSAGRFNRHREVTEADVPEADMRAAAESLRQKVNADLAMVTEADIVRFIETFDRISAAFKNDGLSDMSDELKAFYAESIKSAFGKFRNVAIKQ